MFSTLSVPSCKASCPPWYAAQQLSHLRDSTANPAQIILAIYYTIADIVLLAQCFYYRGFTWRDAPVKQPASTRPTEHTALLGDNQQERRGSDWAGLSPAVPHIPDEPIKVKTQPTVLQAILWNATIVMMVCAAGVLGWYLGEQAKGDRKQKTPSDGNDGELEFNVIGQFFGYLCTVAYIASRLPQLILNYRRKTTDGLSMLFFLFACLGNITYVLSILAFEPKCGGKSCKHGQGSAIYGRYILVNLSWLAGSLVTLFMDFGVFAQYFMYKSNIEPNQAVFFDEEQDAHLINHEEDGRQSGHANGSRDTRPLLQRADSSSYAA